MGIFSNRCEALVNPETGKALYGQALADARKDPSWPRCGATVKKSAHVCSACGAPAPGGWWKCPSCGEWVGNDSHYCHSCNAPLHPDERVAVAGGVWCKNPDVFAARFEVGDGEALAAQGLQVQEGTTAVLLGAGAVQEVLDAGTYARESLTGKMAWFSGKMPRSVVLLDAGEVAVPLRFEDLRTRELAAVGFYGEVVLRFVGGREAGVQFVSNVLRQEREVTFASLAARFEPLFRLAVEEAASSATIDDLVRDPQLRIRLRETMSRLLEDDLRATGLQIVRVSSGEFASSDYANRVRALGDLDAKRRQAEVEMEVRKFESEQELAKMRDEYELRRAKEALEQELRLDEFQRKAAWERLVKQREDELRSQGEQADEARKARDLAERALALQMEEDQQHREAVERVRKQKEEDEARIRARAHEEEERTHRWTLEDTLHTHEREEQRRRRDEAAADRRRKWEEEREIRKQWWEKTQEIWRQQDAARARTRQNQAEDRSEELQRLEHELKLANLKLEDDLAQKRRKLDDQIESEKKLNDAANDKNEANVISNVKIDTIQHDALIEKYKKELELRKEIDERLKARRQDVLRRLDELNRQAANASDPLQKEIIATQIEDAKESLKSIRQELGGKVIC